MPRVENSGPNVDSWCAQSGNGSSTHDLCWVCASHLKRAPKGLKLVPYNGDPSGSDGWFEGVDHPEYAGDNYTCEVCGRTLTSRDD